VTMPRIGSMLLGMGLLIGAWIAYAWAQGVPIVPTAPFGTNTNQAASTAFVQQAIAGSGPGGGGAPPFAFNDTINACAATGNIYTTLSTSTPQTTSLGASTATVTFPTGTFGSGGLGAGAALQISVSGDGATWTPIIPLLIINGAPYPVVGLPPPAGPGNTVSTIINVDGSYLVDLSSQSFIQVSIVQNGNCSNAIPYTLLTMSSVSPMWEGANNSQLQTLNNTAINSNTTLGAISTTLSSFASNYAQRVVGTACSLNAPQMCGLTRLANTTAYAPGQVWSNCNGSGTTGTIPCSPAGNTQQLGYLVFLNACRHLNTAVSIPQITFNLNSDQPTKLSGILRLFTSGTDPTNHLVPLTGMPDQSVFSPTAFATNVGSPTVSPTLGDQGNLIASVPFTLSDEINTASTPKVTGIDLANIGVQGMCGPLNANLYGIIQVTNNYLPTGAETLFVVLKTVSVN